MITQEQRAVLEAIKPRGYKKLVVSRLDKQGIAVSERTVEAVYLGQRDNINVAEAIVLVFKEEDRKKLASKNKLNKKLKIQTE